MIRSAIKTLLPAIAVSSWIALAVLSLLPGRFRLSTGLPKQVEQAAAFFFVALVTRLTIRREESRLQVLVFVLAAATVQVCQIWIPGRSGRLSDWAVCSAGAFFGVLLAKAILEPGLFGLG